MKTFLRLILYVYIFYEKNQNNIIQYESFLSYIQNIKPIPKQALFVFFKLS